MSLQDPFCAALHNKSVLGVASPSPNPHRMICKMIASKQTAPALDWAALIEATLLGATAAMLLAKLASGALVYYIHPRYTPLVKVLDAKIREYGARRFAGTEDEGVWLDPEHDRSAKGLDK